LCDPGDYVVCEEYAYTHAHECIFLPRGLRLLPVRGPWERHKRGLTDEHGVQHLLGCAWFSMVWLGGVLLPCRNTRVNRCTLLAFVKAMVRHSGLPWLLNCAQSFFMYRACYWMADCRWPWTSTAWSQAHSRRRWQPLPRALKLAGDRVFCTSSPLDRTRQARSCHCAANEKFIRSVGACGAG
jgi:hypothetical protein